MSQAAMTISLIAATVISFEPKSIVAVPRDTRLEEQVQAEYEEALRRAYPPPLVSSSGSEPLSTLPFGSSFSETSSSDPGITLIRFEPWH